MVKTKETGRNNHANNWYIKHPNTSFLTLSLTRLRPSNPVVTIIKLPHRTDNKWKSTEAKRIAQVSFRVKIDASHGSTIARTKQEKFRTQQLMPV